MDWPEKDFHSIFISVEHSIVSSQDEDGSQSYLSSDNSNLMTTLDGDAFNSSPVADDSHMSSMDSSSSVNGGCLFIYY